MRRDIPHISRTESRNVQSSNGTRHPRAYTSDLLRRRDKYWDCIGGAFEVLWPMIMQRGRLLGFERGTPALEHDTAFYL
ncbi:MAG: hypothetical protein WC484_02980 [Candidatus Omnitrophota bacterium]